MNPAGARDGQRAEQTPAGRGALAWAVPALGAAALTLVCAIALVAELYESFAASQRLRGLEYESTARAAEIALGLLPWRADARRLLALNLSITGHAPEALVQAREASRWAPAEAETWRVLARVLTQGGEFGPMLTGAVAQAHARDPQSLSMHFSLALDALGGWPQGNADVHALWLRSLRFIMKRDSARFMRRVAVMRRENAFCYYVGDALRRRPWCNRVGRVRADCSREDLDPGQRQWCNSVGFRRLQPR